MEEQTNEVETKRDEEKSPYEWAQYWNTEIDAARKAFDKWHRSAEITLRAFLDDIDNPERQDNETRLNFFWANTITLRALLFGNTPKVDVTRRFGDADDDEARVAGPVILARILNTDIETGTDGTVAALRNALSDFITVGFGNAWCRYEARFVTKPAITGPDGAEAAPEAPKKVWEDAPIDYIYWKNQLWSPCRTYEELRWIGKRVLLTKKQMKERFGEELVDSIQAAGEDSRKTALDSQSKDAKSRIEVWELWDKEHMKVFWYVDGHPEVLDIKDDPLGLKDFWPCPRPMLANLTTSAFMPRCDYAMVQDLYRDINSLMSRISLLERALRVAGIYDKSLGELNELLRDRALENILLPVDSMAALQDKGGLEKSIAYLPIEEIASTISTLEDKLQRRQELLYELTGLSDLTRGAEGMNEQTATETRTRARYSNVRIQTIQDEFTRFASDLQSIRAEIITRYFDDETILARSNVLRTPDAVEAQASLKTLREEFPGYRIAVQPETVAMADFAALKQDRSDFLQGFSTLIKDAIPLIQILPQALPILLEIIKWSMAGFRGSGEIEGVLDRAIKQAQSNPLTNNEGTQQNPEQMKLQAKLIEMAAKAQIEQAATQQKIQAEQAKEEAQSRSKIAEVMATEEIKAKYRQHEAAIKAATSLPGGNNVEK